MSLQVRTYCTELEDTVKKFKSQSMDTFVQQFSYKGLS